MLGNTAFYPVKANKRATLFTNNTDTVWWEIFRHSYSVHFYGQITSGRGWRTGHHTAYDYLGQRFCPAAYSVQGNMDLWI